MLRPVLLLSSLACARAHAHMVQPPPRNAVDKDLPPWNGPMPARWNHKVDSYICPMAAGDGSMSNLTLSNGQACFYFSHGCTIQCDACDGKTVVFPQEAVLASGSGVLI